MKSNFIFILLWLTSTIICMILLWPRLEQRFQLNLAASSTTHAILADTNRLPQTYISSKGISTSICRSNWFRGLIADVLLLEDERDQAWKKLIMCSPQFIHMVMIVAPENQELAEFAVVEHPDNSEAWFWLAEIHSDKAPLKAIDLLRKGLFLNPRDGQRWLKLGQLLVESNPQDAIEAFLQACNHGDPGWNGCWLAGHAAERLGEVEKAIQYYRLSDWAGALERAAQLERQLQEQTLP